MVNLANTASSYESPWVYLQESETVVSPVVWWIIAVIVLLALGAIIATAVIIWCISHGGGFVITWRQDGGFPFNIHLECSK